MDSDGGSVEDGPKEQWHDFAHHRRCEECQGSRLDMSLSQPRIMTNVITSMSKLTNSKDDVMYAYEDFLYRSSFVESWSGT
jgi:excinuclease UvrABC ATPase subunit